MPSCNRTNVTNLGVSNSLSVGVTTVLQLGGKITAVMTASPVQSYFRRTFRPYTAFSLGDIKVPFGAGVEPSFGANITANVPAAGHSLMDMTMQVVLSGLKACPSVAGECGSQVSSRFPVEVAPGAHCSVANQAAFDSVGGRDEFYSDQYVSMVAPDDQSAVQVQQEDYVYYCPSVGWALIKSANFVGNEVPIATTFSEYFFAHEEILGRPGAELMEEVGRYMEYEELIAASANDMVLYVPMLFWFSECSETAFPVASAYGTEMQLHAQLRNASECIVRSGPSTEVKLSDAHGGGPVTNALKASLLVRFAYLSPAEVALKLNTTENFVYYLVDRQEQDIQRQQENLDFRFKSAMIDMFLMFRRKCNCDANNWFDFSGIDGLPPLETASIELSGHTLQAKRYEMYYRKVQPYWAQAKLPSSYVYYYSSSLLPRFAANDPSGCTAVERMQNNAWVLEMQPELAKESPKAILIMRRYTYVSFTNGSIVQGTL